MGDPVSTDFGWWLYLRVAGVLFSAFGLALAVLELGPSLRLFGLAAVTTTGTWFVAAAFEPLALQPSGYQPAAPVVVITVTLLGLGGAYLGQLRRPVRATAASSSG